MNRRKTPFSWVKTPLLLALTILALTLLTLTPLAMDSPPDQTAAQAAAPQLTVEPESLDFGVMQQLQVHNRQIILRNDGDATLKIENVTTSCGCVTARVDTNELAPGASTTLTVTFNSKKYTGHQVKYVRLHSNNPHQPDLKIVVSADIQPPLFTDPKYKRLGFGRIYDGEMATKKAELWTEAVPRLELELQFYNTKLFDVSVEPDPDDDPRRAVLVVHLKPDAPSGRHREYIRLTTNIPALPFVDFELFFDVFQVIEVSQQRINFRYVKADQLLERRIRVWATGPGTTFAITGAEVDLPHFAAVIEQTAPDTESFVTITGHPLPMDDPLVKETQGHIRGTLKIFTDHPDQPELTVEIIYLLRNPAGKGP